MVSSKKVQEHFILQVLLVSILGGALVAIIRHAARRQGYDWLADNWG